MAVRTALVTGATAGLGAAFVRRLAADGYHLVLVARGGERLAEMAEEVAGRYGVTATPMVADLSTDEGCAAVEERLRDPAAPIDLLVNNAGRTLNTAFVRSTAEKEASLLRLNVDAVMRLTLAALPTMIERRQGAVVNVSSVSGFFAVMPGSTYPASKAWVTNFTQSVALSVRRYGVRVMVLCPGYTRTEFHERAGIDESKIPGWLWLDADAVVRDGLRDLRRGKIVSIPTWKYKVLVAVGRHAPLRLVGRVSRDTRGR